MLLEIFGMALVDSYLLARKFVPRWQNADDNDGIFWKYVVALLPKIAASNDGGPTRSLYKCQQVLIGKKKSGTWEKCRQSGGKATTLCVLH
jgi:hypothetical protein